MTTGGLTAVTIIKHVDRAGVVHGSLMLAVISNYEMQMWAKLAVMHVCDGVRTRKQFLTQFEVFLYKHGLFQKVLRHLGGRRLEGF